MKKNKQELILSKYVKYFLKEKPFFYVFIRPVENYFFNKHKKYLGKNILDFGSGDGFFKQAVFPKKKMEGLDVFGSDSYLANFKAYNKITLYDGNKIPFVSSKFETVISNSVLEHVPNIKRTMQEINRITKPGGYFICSVMTKNWDNWLFGKNIFGNYYNRYMKKKQQHSSLLSEKEWEKLFVKSGFKIIVKEKYLTKKISRLLELSHFLSFPSLFLHKFFNKWTLGLSANKLVVNFLSKFIYSESMKAKESSSLFFVLQKK